MKVRAGENYGAPSHARSHGSNSSAFGRDRHRGAVIPPRPTVKKLQKAACGCQACPLWKTGTQTVFGDGSRNAKLVFVGEQPGNDEDLAGKPFVGPAGKLLDKPLVEAGINRDEVYVTNRLEYGRFVEDIKKIAKVIHGSG